MALAAFIEVHPLNCTVYNTDILFKTIWIAVSDITCIAASPMDTENKTFISTVSGKEYHVTDTVEEIFNKLRSLKE